MLSLQGKIKMLGGEPMQMYIGRFKTDKKRNYFFTQSVMNYKVVP